MNIKGENVCERLASSDVWRANGELNCEHLSYASLMPWKSSKLGSEPWLQSIFMQQQQVFTPMVRIIVKTGQRKSLKTLFQDMESTKGERFCEQLNRNQLGWIPSPSLFPLFCVYSSAVMAFMDPVYGFILRNRLNFQ